MNNCNDRMEKLETDINDFLEANQQMPATSFPHDRYKTLNKRLSNIHIEMASQNSGIHIEEGVAWLQEQFQKLTNFLKISKNK